VLHVMIDAGVAPSRLSMTGYGEFQPIAANDTAEGRNANRRVMLVILPPGEGTDSVTRDAAVAARTPTDAQRRAG
jgi:chemotaxis protein MotB